MWIRKGNMFYLFEFLEQIQEYRQFLLSNYIVVCALQAVLAASPVEDG